MMLDIGLSQEELRELVIQRAADQLVHDMADEDFGRFMNIEDMVREAARTAANKVAEEKVLPLIQAGVDSLIIQETNRYGEANGQTYTFTEYMVARANEYLQAPVDYQGKEKGESTFGWSKNQNRLTYLIGQHLQFTIKSSMEQALDTVKKAVVPALEETVKHQLQAVAAKLKVSVSS